jgi:Putative peptidoglycan binding domain
VTLATSFEQTRPVRRRRRQSAREEAAPSDAHGVLALQRQAGNAATTALIQRQPTGTSVGGAPPATAEHPFLMKGYSGQGVRKLQQRLNVLGAEPRLKVDSAFGKLTKQAVVDFQTAHFPDDDKQWDGKVGNKTWAAIDEAYQPPEIDAEEDALGEHVKDKMDQMNTQEASADSGVHYHYNYRHDYPDRYKADYESGFADPALFDKEGWMTWRVKPKTSASAAIQSWLRGLTIAECKTAMYAAEYDAVRAAVGDEKFDEKFGSTDKAMPKEQRMLISTTGGQVQSLLKATDAAAAGDVGAAGNRPAKVGEWYYFMNHPRYLLKHPGGAWQGENAIFVGREGTANVQMWSGLGTSGGTGPAGESHVTEDQMLAEMVKAYNDPRDVDDEHKLEEVKRANGGVLPPQLVEDGTQFPDKLGGPADILSAPPEKLDVPGFIKDDRDRVPGFLANVGKRLDPAAIQAMRDS